LEVSARINIVHISTELRVAWRRFLEDSRKRQPNEVVAYKILLPVVDSVKQVVAFRLRRFIPQSTGEDNRKHEHEQEDTKRCRTRPPNHG
jgi:hypothetical protein